MFTTQINLFPQDILSMHISQHCLPFLISNAKKYVCFRIRFVCKGLARACGFIIRLVTVLVLIKLTKLAVALRLRCGSCKLIFWHYFIMRLGVSPGSKLCATFLNIAKYFRTLRYGCGALAFIFSIYLKPGLYHKLYSSAFNPRIFYFDYVCMHCQNND